MHITEDTLIGDILAKLPESADIMEAYGLHCTSCSVNTFEPIKAGAMSHGMPEETAEKMIAELNRLWADRPKAPDDDIYMTAFAAEKVQLFAEMEDKAGWGLRITAKREEGQKEPSYTMDFEKDPQKEDTVREFHGSRLFMDESSFDNLKGAVIDYIEGPFGSGFKIDNSRFKKECCGGGGCGNGGCGSGSCGCK